MRRYVPLLIAGTALIAAACRDSTSPPQATPARTMSAMLGGSNVSSARANDRAEGKAATFNFQLNPEGGSVRIGAFRLDYPAGAVCDPNRSGYGPDEWKKPCIVLDRTITLRARFWSDNGTAYADFSPDIRFAPDKQVALVTMITDLRNVELTDALRAQYAIGYTLREGTTRFFVDESANDPSLATVFGLNPNGTANGWAVRRIYHFSGYYVRSGKWCETGSSDPECGGMY